MEWPRIDGHTPKGRNISFEIPMAGNLVDARLFSMSVNQPHLCDVPGCPGPRLVAKLEAAERLHKAARAAREVMTAVFSTRRDGPGRQAYDMLADALAAWDSAGEGQ